MKTNKFRVWDKEIHTWLMPSSKPARNISIFDSYGVLSLVDEDDKLVWCQFTGLYDKNGKEIYEGYIIKVHNLYSGDDTFHVVAWFGETGYPAFDLEPNLEDDCNSLASVFQSGNYEIEIVGNIYENPILLKEDCHD